MFLGGTQLCPDLRQFGRSVVEAASGVLQSGPIVLEARFPLAGQRKTGPAVCHLDDEIAVPRIERRHHHSVSADRLGDAVLADDVGTGLHQQGQHVLMGHGAAGDGQIVRAHHHEADLPGTQHVERVRQQRVLATLDVG